MCKILREVSEAIYLSTPSAEEEWKAIAEDFFNGWNMPNVIGAVDGKHFAMEYPKYGGSLFYNYKQLHSTVMLAMCDAKYRFTYVNIGSFGRDNDAAIFASSDFLLALKLINTMCQTQWQLQNVRDW